MFHCYSLTIKYCYNFTLKGCVWVMKPFLQTRDAVNYCIFIGDSGYKAFPFLPDNDDKKVNQIMENTRAMIGPCVH